MTITISMVSPNLHELVVYSAGASVKQAAGTRAVEAWAATLAR